MNNEKKEILDFIDRIDKMTDIQITEELNNLLKNQILTLQNKENGILSWPQPIINEISGIEKLLSTAINAYSLTQGREVNSKLSWYIEIFQDYLDIITELQNRYEMFKDNFKYKLRRLKESYNVS